MSQNQVFPWIAGVFAALRSFGLVTCFFTDGEMIEGELKSNRTKLVQAWIEIHQEELMANWELATSGQEIFKIDPLK